MLIEDDLDDQEIFYMALNDVDPTIECTIIDNCTEAIEKLKSDISLTPDYIFIDANMPKLNGLQCLEIINNINHLQGSKIILYSTYFIQEIIVQGKNLGVNEFIVKNTLYFCFMILFSYSGDL